MIAVMVSESVSDQESEVFDFEDSDQTACDALVKALEEAGFEVHAIHVVGGEEVSCLYPTTS